MITREQLEALAHFLPVLAKPEFKAGEMQQPRQLKSNLYTVPHASYTEAANDLVKVLYAKGWIRSDFDWPNWAPSPEARALRDDPAALAEATADQLAKLLTVVVRQERFSDGALLAAFDSGLILGIVRRAAAILDAERE